MGISFPKISEYLFEEGQPEQDEKLNSDNKSEEEKKNHEDENDREN